MNWMHFGRDVKDHRINMNDQQPPCKSLADDDLVATLRGPRKPTFHGLGGSSFADISPVLRSRHSHVSSLPESAAYPFSRFQPCSSAQS